MKRIVITGPTGAIGMALIKKCLAEHVEVLAICHQGSKRMKRIPEHPLVKVCECNLDKLSEMDIAGGGKYDIFYHLAWAGTTGDGRNHMPVQLDNIRYTLDAVTLAHRLGCTAFVGAGSQAEYGRVEGALDAGTPVFPENGYGMAKLCAGQMSRVECHRLGMRHIWTRILSIYGPGDTEASMISGVIKTLLNGEKPALTAGEQLWDYLYCDDAAEALFLLGSKGLDGKIYCIGSGSARPLREYIEILRDKIDPQLELGFGEIPYGEKQVMYLKANIDDLKNDVGFEPKVSFEKGIKYTIDWVKEGSIWQS